MKYRKRVSEERVKRIAKIKASRHTLVSVSYSNGFSRNVSLNEHPPYQDYMDDVRETLEADAEVIEWSSCDMCPHYHPVIDGRMDTDNQLEISKETLDVEWEELPL
jgi:hypothetical protein